MIKNLNIDEFLNNYWQQKPLLIRNAFPDYKSPISAEELAGLACEEFIESRIILENTSEEKIKTEKWSLENGPFPESRFSSLPGSHWTLLIQGLNKVFPEFDDLLHQFNFIPNWRMDDLMASYAAPDGSVGPHIDQYDVFLLQASGRRKWMISEEPVTADNFEENLPLKIIKDFKPQSEWILETGDMLYLPPNVAHYGIGMDNCMTFSIGFRAPSYAELLSSFIDEQLSGLDDNLRYTDSHLSENQNNGEITAQAIKNVQQILLSQINDKSKIEDWFGHFITEYLSDDEIINENSLSVEEFSVVFIEKNILRRPATIRANYIINQDGVTSLYINGSKQNVNKRSADIARLFCNHHIIRYTDIKHYLTNNTAVEFLCSIYNKGYLEFSND